MGMEIGAGGGLKRWEMELVDEGEGYRFWMGRKGVAWE